MSILAGQTNKVAMRWTPRAAMRTRVGVLARSQLQERVLAWTAVPRLTDDIRGVCEQLQDIHPVPA